MDRITVRLEATGYVAQYIGPHAAIIVTLFGTDALPTPYTPSASMADVLSDVKARNPGVLVLSSDADTYRARSIRRNGLAMGDERSNATWALMDGLDDWAGSDEGQAEMDAIDAELDLVVA